MELDEAEAGQAKSEAPAQQPEPAKVTAVTEEPAKQPEPAQAVVAKEKPAQATAKKKPAKQFKVAKAKSATPAQQPEAAKGPAVLVKGKVEPEPGVTFAPNHLLPLATSHRRPGPSMNMFLDMARGVKAPTRSVKTSTPSAKTSTRSVKTSK